MLKLDKKLETERAVYFTQLGGFDTHADLKDTMALNMGRLDSALKSFIEEVKIQGLWDNITIVTNSDFGRTLTSNGQGTDHGWGGHSLVMGGALQGGQVFGKYPSSLKKEYELNIGRGRLLPTTSWEALWLGVLQWLGVNENQMATVLPNLANFPEEHRIRGMF